MVYLKKGEILENKILYERICKLIAISYAISEDEVLNAYTQLGSLDILLIVLKQCISTKLSLSQAIEEYKND